MPITFNSSLDLDVSALAALDSFDLLATAAPLNTGKRSIASIDAATLVEFAPQLSTVAGQPTVTHWETTTVIEQSVPTSVPGTGQGPQAWVLPESFTDLSSFGNKRIAYGSPNIAVVTGIPASASATSAPSASPTYVPASSTPYLPRPWTNSSAAFRLFFPSGSINPGNKPQGGSDFYAAPISLQTATNVTLQYSVFFPADFAWVNGGKLPGLYGGHGGCSGGNDAKTCFSTRMMWRQRGAGELYLYAPKDKQTQALCQAPPQSVCDATYGLSVGRGSFHFTAGDWTHISQTVRLNTPGKQDGGFELLVNGHRIMRRDDVFYRDVPSSPDAQDDGGGGSDGSGDGDNDGGGGDGSDGSGDDGGMGDLLGDLLKRDAQVSEETVDNILDEALLPALLAPSESESLDPLENSVAVQAPLFAPEAASLLTAPAKESMDRPQTPIPSGSNTVTATSTVTSTQRPTGFPVAPQAEMESQDSTSKPIGFSGIFFSTFFGGHEQSWASPKDQYTYFKDFGLTVNA
ncbi:polysaccharide lyase family 14 protein [Ramaria rubella]|nr:polysaccharide lyase family 14 protein [Ramaria rubella]